MKSFIRCIIYIFTLLIANNVLAYFGEEGVSRSGSSTYFSPRIYATVDLGLFGDDEIHMKPGDIRYLFPVHREAYIGSCDASGDPPPFIGRELRKISDDLLSFSRSHMSNTIDLLEDVDAIIVFQDALFTSDLESMDKVMENDVCSDPKGDPYCRRYKAWRSKYSSACICVRERTLPHDAGNVMGEVSGCYLIPLAPGPKTGVDFFKKLAAFRVVPYRDFSFSYPFLKVGIGGIKGKECNDGSKVGRLETCSDGSLGRFYGVQWKDIDFNNKSIKSDSINYENDDYYYKIVPYNNKACIEYYGFDSLYKNKIRETCFYGIKKLPLPREVKKVANKIEFVVGESKGSTGAIVKEKATITIPKSSGGTVSNFDTKYQMLFLTNPKFNDDYSRKYKKYCVKSGNISEYNYSHTCPKGEGGGIYFDSANTSSTNYCIAGGNFNNYIYNYSDMGTVKEIVRLHNNGHLIIPKTTYHNSTTGDMEYIDDYARSSHKISDLSQNDLDTLLYSQDDLFNMNDKLYAYDIKEYYALLDKTKVDQINFKIKSLPDWGEGYGYHYTEVNTVTDYHKLGLNAVVGSNVAVATQYLDINNQPYAIVGKDLSPFKSKSSRDLKANPEFKSADEFENGLCVTNFIKREYSYKDAVAQPVITDYNANKIAESSDSNANNNFSSNGIIIDSSNANSHFNKKCRFLRFKVWAGGSSGYVAKYKSEESRFSGAKAFSGASSNYFEGVINAENLPVDRKIIHILVGKGGSHDHNKYLIKGGVTPIGYKINNDYAAIKDGDHDPNKYAVHGGIISADYQVNDSTDLVDKSKIIHLDIPLQSIPSDSISTNLIYIAKKSLKKPKSTYPIVVVDGAKKFKEEAHDREGGDTVILLCDDEKGSNCDVISRIYGGRDQGSRSDKSTIGYDVNYGFYAIETKKSLSGEINRGILKSPLQNGLKSGDIENYIDIAKAGCEPGNHKAISDYTGAGGCANQNEKLYQGGGDGRVEVICENWDR